MTFSRDLNRTKSNTICRFLQKSKLVRVYVDASDRSGMRLPAQFDADKAVILQIGLDSSDLFVGENLLSGSLLGAGSENKVVIPMECVFAARCLDGDKAALVWPGYYSDSVTQQLNAELNKHLVRPAREGNVVDFAAARRRLRGR